MGGAIAQYPERERAFAAAGDGIISRRVLEPAGETEATRVSRKPDGEQSSSRPSP